MRLWEEWLMDGEGPRGGWGGHMTQLQAQDLALGVALGALGVFPTGFGDNTWVIHTPTKTQLLKLPIYTVGHPLIKDPLESLATRHPIVSLPPLSTKPHLLYDLKRLW